MRWPPGPGFVQSTARGYRVLPDAFLGKLEWSPRPTWAVLRSLLPDAPVLPTSDYQTRFPSTKPPRILATVLRLEPGPTGLLAPPRQTSSLELSV